MALAQANISSLSFCYMLLLVTGLALNTEGIYQESIDLEDLKSLFGEDECIEGSLSLTESGEPIITSGSYISSVDTPMSTETKVKNVTVSEKSPISLLYELAEFNQLKAQFTLTDEKGPSHKKNFVVSLKLGEEEYIGEGSSIKKAQQEASRLALNSTLHSHPPTKIKNNIVFDNNKTPTQKLDIWAKKHNGATIVYSYFEQTEINKGPHKNFHHSGMYSKPKNIHKVRVSIGKQVFSGEGESFELAKQNAASHALKSLQNVDGFCMLTDKEQSFFNKVFSSNSENDSPISVVHEFGTVSNMPVSFDLYSEEGPAHIKKFVIRCNVGDTFESFGEGSSKKSAKKEAAENMIQQLKRHASFNGMDCVNSPKKGRSKKKKPRNLIKSVVKTYYEEEYVTNDIAHLVEEELDPVSKLFQIQQAKHDTLPVFTFLEKSNNEFLIEVKVNDLTATGSGPNKKSAKKKAAQEMIEKMGYSANKKTFTQEKRKEFSITEPSKKKNISPGIHLNSGIVHDINNKKQSAHNLQTDENNNLHKLKDEKFTKLSDSMPKSKDSKSDSSKSESNKKFEIRPKSQLKNLSQQLGFRFQFSDFPKVNNSGFVSMVSLTTDPPKVCYGVAETSDRAQDKAALSALGTLYKSEIDHISQLLREENTESSKKTVNTMIEEDNLVRSGATIETD